MNLLNPNPKPNESEDERKKKFLIVCGIIMALMIGLRYKGVGSGDTQFYYNNWELMSEVPFSLLSTQLTSVDLEYGYQICVWLLSHIFPWGQWLLIFTGIFFSFAVCRFTFRNSKNPILSLVLFNCLGLFNFMVQGLRQSIAMSICLFAYEYCKNKKFWRFAILIIIACLFHSSAVIFAIVYILNFLKLDIKRLGLFALMIIIGFNLLPTIFKFMNYVMNDNYDMTSAAESGGVVAILIYVVIILFGLLFKDNSDKRYSLFIYCTMVATISMVFRNSLNVIAERISYYFAFGAMIVLSNGVSSIKDSQLRAIFSIIATGLCFGVAIHKASYSVLIPYTFFWQV